MLLYDVYYIKLGMD